MMKLATELTFHLDTLECGVSKVLDWVNLKFLPALNCDYGIFSIYHKVECMTSNIYKAGTNKVQTLPLQASVSPSVTGVRLDKIICNVQP